MTALKAELDARFSAAWQAMEEATTKLIELNDLCYDESGEPLFKVPRPMAMVLEAKAKEIKQEASTFEALKEPRRALPSLPRITA